MYFVLVVAFPKQNHGQSHKKEALPSYYSPPAPTPPPPRTPMKNRLPSPPPLLRVHGVRLLCRLQRGLEGHGPGLHLVPPAAPAAHGQMQRRLPVVQLHLRCVDFQGANKKASILFCLSLKGSLPPKKGNKRHHSATGSPWQHLAKGRVGGCLLPRALLISIVIYCQYEISSAVLLLNIVPISMCLTICVSSCFFWFVSSFL